MAFIFILSALVFIAGITFLIIGIILKSKKHYIPAIIGMIISFIVCAVLIFMFLFRLGKKFNDEVIRKGNIEIVKDIKFNQNDNGENSFTIVFKSRSSSDENNKKEESLIIKKINFIISAKGFITDQKNNLVYVKVFMEKSVADNGVVVNSISNKKNQKDDPSGIILNMDFKEIYSDTLKLFMLNEEREVLDSCLLNINEKENKQKNIVFLFGKNSKIADSRYYYLTDNKITKCFLNNNIKEPEEE